VCRGLFDDFVMQLDHRVAKHVDNGGAALGQMIVPAPSFSLADRGFGTQPPVPFETLKQRIQRPRTDVVPVSTQFREHPLADDRALSRVVKDVDFPEPKENLARQQFRIQRCHGLVDRYYDKRKRMCDSGPSLLMFEVVAILSETGTRA
jgi:hypothetical protein